MNKITDTELVNDLKTGQNLNESLSELVERNSGIFINMVNQYMKDSVKYEVINDKEYYIYQAALKYDDSRNTKFSTYLGSETKWMCLNDYNKKKKRKEVAIDFLENVGDEGDHFDQVIEYDTKSKILELASNHPDKRVYKIFELRYNEGNRNKLMPWSKICKKVGLSVQGCINIHEQALNKIKQELKKDI
jgi:RNA polymerase sigma factor (sigma-70 family)